MAAELTTIKLNADEHLLLDQPLLRLPAEVNRANLKAAQIAIEQAKKSIVPTCNNAVSTAHKAISVSEPLDDAGSAEVAKTAMAAIDSMIQKTNVLKRKLSAISPSTDAANASLGARLKHMDEVRTIPSLADVKYDEWTRMRLDRLLVDHLLRHGYTASAKRLAESKGILDLVRVEIDSFEACGKIERSLKEGKSTKEAISWCEENKKELGKIDSDLRFELRLQQFIELVRQGKTLEALVHGKKYLNGHRDWPMVERAAGLMIFSANVQFEPLQSLFSNKRWSKLADLFVQTHHQLYSIPAVPLLNTALSAGLSALKTPACHSKNSPSASGATVVTESMPATNGHASGSSGRESLIVSLPTSNGESHARPRSKAPPKMSSWTTPICPICSTELNALARDVPYAHHSKSHVDHDPVLLPNGRIYGSERLTRVNEKLGTEQGKVRDPLDGTEYDLSVVRKVYIT